MRQRIRDNRAKEWHNRVWHNHVCVTTDEHSTTYSQDDDQEPEYSLGAWRDCSIRHDQHPRQHDSIFHSTGLITAGYALDR